MKREIICLQLEFRTSGCEIQRQKYSIIQNLMKSTIILKCRKPVILRYDVMMTSSGINKYILHWTSSRNSFWIARNWNLFSDLSTLKSPPCLEWFELNLRFSEFYFSAYKKRHKRSKRLLVLITLWLVRANSDTDLRWQRSQAKNI